MSEPEPEFSQFLHIDPLYDSEQSARYQRIKQTANQLTDLSKLIGNYIEAGRKFSNVILELYEGISQIDLVVVNSCYSSLSDTIVTWNMLLMNHLNQVEVSMHVPTQSFIKHDLSSMKKMKNDYFAVNEKFMELSDKLFTTGKKSLTPEKKQKIIELHKQSSHSFCEYVLQLDMTESRYNNLIGNILLGFNESVIAEHGTQLAEIYQKKQQDITTIQEEIRKSNEDITQKMFQSNETHTLVDAQIDQYYDTIDKHFTGEPSTQIQGYLWKKKGTFGNQFEKLFCVCRDGFFAASASPQTCARPLWTQQLVYCDIKSVDNEDKPFCFSIISRDKTTIMQAQSMHEKEKWIATLMKSKNEQFECSSNEAVTEANNERTCADCGMVGADWLITNRGAVLCNQCASIHRSHASSISRVRSLKMDTNTSIDQYSIELLNNLGNDAINSILEANVVGKITPESTREEREAFIHKKYIDKAFMTTEKVDLTKMLKTQNLVGLLHCILDGSINDKLQGGLTALHAAAIVGSPLMTTLIAANCPAMLNVVDDFRWTPLMYATYFNHFFVVDSLIIYNADPVCDCLVQPYIIAASKKYEDIAEILAKYRPENFEIMKEEAPETGFEPEDVDLTPFKKHLKKIMHSKTPPRIHTNPMQTKRKSLAPKGLPSLI